MSKYSSGKRHQRRQSVIESARRALSHVLVFGVISIGGHMATTTLAQSAGKLGGGIYPPVGGMSFSYGS